MHRHIEAQDMKFCYSKKNIVFIAGLSNDSIQKLEFHQVMSNTTFVGNRQQKFKKLYMKKVGRKFQKYLDKKALNTTRLRHKVQN